MFLSPGETDDTSTEKTTENPEDTQEGRSNNENSIENVFEQKDTADDGTKSETDEIILNNTLDCADPKQSKLTDDLKMKSFELSPIRSFNLNRPKTSPPRTLPPLDSKTTRKVKNIYNIF